MRPARALPAPFPSPGPPPSARCRLGLEQMVLVKTCVDVRGSVSSVDVLHGLMERLGGLGVHVVERGVIFVDLSLAQIAALGATIAIFRGKSAAIPINARRGVLRPGFETPG